MRMQSSEEIENILIEERISHFHRGMHRYAITFSLEQVSGQSNARGDPYAPVERMPTFGSIQWHLQVAPGIGCFQHLPHSPGVKAKLGQPEHSVSIDPGIGATD